MNDGQEWVEKHTQISNSWVVVRVKCRLFLLYLEYKVRAEYHTTQIDRQQTKGKSVSRVPYPSICLSFHIPQNKSEGLSHATLTK